MSRLNLASTCRSCGFATSMSGDDAVQVMKAIDAAHDVLKPECDQAVARSVPTEGNQP